MVARIVVYRKTKHYRRDILLLAILCTYFVTLHCPQSGDGPVIYLCAQCTSSAHYTDEAKGENAAPAPVCFGVYAVHN